MSILTEDSAISAIGDLSALKSSELLFVYPIIFDSKLEKKYGRLIRDFQTLQFMSQIKVANILNITKSAVKKDKQQDDYIPPSEMLSSVLNAGTNDDAMFRYHMAQRQNSNYDDNANKPHPKDIEYKLTEKFNFIKNHLKTDPRYDNLNPVFSLITVEHTLIEIPLILGSKIEKLNSQGMFWLLFLAAALKLPLNDAVNVSAISNNITKIPSRRYLKILDDANIISDSTPDDNNRLYNKLKGEAVNDLKKAGDKFNRLAGNLGTFENEVGINTGFKSKEELTFSSFMVGGENAESRANVKTKTISLLTQMLSSSVFPVIQTYNNIIVDVSSEVNFPAKYSYLHSKIVNNSENVTDSIIGQVANVFTNANTGNDYSKNFKNVCNSLNSLSPNNELAQLNKLVLTYSQVTANIESNNNAIFSDINEVMVRTSMSLTQKTEQIVNFIQSFTSGATDGQFDFKQVVNQYKETTVELLRGFYYDNTDGGGIIISPPQGNNNNLSEIFRRLYSNQQNPQQRFDNFVTQFITALADIITFSFVFSAIGYVCDFIKEIDTKVKVQEASVISFPNYTLVVPLEYLRMLYFAIGARNIVNIANENDIDVDHKDFNFKENEIFKILTSITNLLQIPNLVIIDEKSKSVYYKWVFSKRLLKVNISTIEGYNRSQSDVVRVL